MSTRDKRWRELPMTQKQEDLMESLGIPNDPNMTRGEASDAITAYEEEAPHPFSEEALQP